MLIFKAARGQMFEFEPISPNQDTVDAIKDARRGDLSKLGTLQEAMARLTKEL